MGAGDDASKFYTGLKQGGYATDPDYVKKGVNVAAGMGKMPDGTAPADGGTAPTGAAVSAVSSAPTAQAQTALQVPAVKQAVADDLAKMEAISTRTFIDPKTKFTVSPDGTVMMQEPPRTNDKDSDYFLRIARVAASKGNANMFKQAMDSHLQMKSEEQNQMVDNIMKSDMSDDNKVAALAHGTGIKIYKTADGQYVAPSLTGDAGSNGQYKRLNFSDIGTMAKQLSTPEGIKNLYAHQMKMQENDIQQQRANTESRTQQVAEQKNYYEENAGIPGSPAALRVAQTHQAEDSSPTKIATATIHAKAAEDRATAAAEAARQRAIDAENRRLGRVPNMEPTPDKTGWNVMLHTGNGGAAETHAMQDAPNLPGMPETPGLMRTSAVENLKADWTKYKATDPRLGDPSQDHTIMPVAQYNPGSKTAVEPRDKDGNPIANPNAGTYLYQLSAINPATGRKEPYIWDPESGYPVFGAAAAGHGYKSYAAAKKAADEMDKTYIRKGNKKVSPMDVTPDFNTALTVG